MLDLCHATLVFYRSRVEAYLSRLLIVASKYEKAGYKRVMFRDRQFDSIVRIKADRCIMARWASYLYFLLMNNQV